MTETKAEKVDKKQRLLEKMTKIREKLSRQPNDSVSNMSKEEFFKQQRSYFDMIQRTLWRDFNHQFPFDPKASSLHMDVQWV